MAFGGLGVFPPRGAPRVVWLGAVEGASAAASVQQFMAARIEALGIEAERRPFRAHVTLGRWRNARPPDAARVRSAAGAVAVARIAVDEIALYESRQEPSGSVYTPIARARLAHRS
jgi:2'-5' RNA ligase